MSAAYGKLVERIKDWGRLSAIEQLLDWDQEVNMPPGGAAARAELLSLIAGLGHEAKTSDEMGRLLSEAKDGNGDNAAATNIREMRRARDRAVRVPTDLVKRIAHTASLAKTVWAKARTTSDFAQFSPWLEKLIALKREEADRVGYTTEPYDALMDEYEPGALSTEVEALFTSLRQVLVPLVREVTTSKRQPDPSILTRNFPRGVQEVLCRRVAGLLNFDFDRGRSDVSVHPFCTTIAPYGDVRITTRYDDHFLPAGMYGTMHEVGHALYEQGLLADHAYTPMAQAVSLGIHESQSRMWENMVGRGRAFCEYIYPELQKLFGDSLGQVTVDQFYGAVNVVRPSLIRVEADEVTYNLHIILRFEMERALISGKLNVRDIPEAWNQKMTDTVGIRPPNDAQGCMQDIHWSMGSFGYFPTYALGNLYAAQFYAQAGKDVPDLQGRIRRGELRPLLDWLRTNIHQHGRRYRAGELVERVTGRSLSIEPFTAYARDKFGALYDVRP